MSFDQTVSFDDFFLNSQLTEKARFLVNFFELNDAFHSWWFSLAVLFLSFNLIVCSIERLPRIYFDALSPRPYLTDRRLLGIPLQKRVFVKNYQEALHCAQKFLGSKKALLANIGNDHYFFSEKFKIARFGVYIVHIALLIVMFSSIFATQMGVDANVLIEEGEKERFLKAKGVGGVNYTYDLGFNVGCTDFRLTTFSDNTPMEFESDLYIEDLATGKKLVSKTVTVNNPLSYAGFTFYQATYQAIMSEKVVKVLVEGQNNFKKIYNLRLNESITLEDKSTFMPTKIYEDFAGLGQALRIDWSTAAGEKTFFHIFRRYPKLDENLRDEDYTFIFLDTDQKYATGLSVGKLPGISIIFSGFLLLLVGLFLCFFLVPTRYFCRITKTSDGFDVFLAAQGFRHPQTVKSDFLKRLSSSIGEEHA